MLTEKTFEDIICKYPDLIEDGLSLKGRQIRIYGKIMDVLFEDKFGQKLIIELKVGPIDRKHIGQVMEYEGGVLSIEDPTARIMLIGNRVPPNLKKALDHHGIEWKEVSLAQLKEFIIDKNDSALLCLFDEFQEKPAIEIAKKSSSILMNKESSGAWIFQTNPKYFKMVEKLKYGNDMDAWQITRFREEVKKGDTVLIWISGQNAGIYAVGEITSNPAEMTTERLLSDDKEQLLYSTEEGKQAFKKSYTIAWVQYKKKFITNPILREYLNDNSALNSLSIIQQPQGTNFRVTREQWAELKKYPQISDFTRAGMMEDSEQIDWKNPDSHLSLIKNQNTLDRINYMRKRIKEIDKDVIESGRQSWMTYRIHGRLFVAIGCVAKNGNFTLGIQNLPPDEVKLNGHRSKDWGSGAQRNKSTIITFGPTVDYKDIDNLLEYIRIAYKKASVSTDRIIDASEQIDWNLHESHLSRITNMEIKDKINYLREKIESMDSDIDKGGRGDRKGGRPGWMIYRVYGHSGRGRIFVSIGEISHKSFVVAIHPMSKARKVAGYEAKPWRRGECNPNTAVGHYRLPANISHEDLDRIIQCIRDAYMYNRSRV